MNGEDLSNQDSFTFNQSRCGKGQKRARRAADFIEEKKEN
jgi:hypothetical protein